MYLVSNHPWYRILCCMALVGFHLSCKKTSSYLAPSVHREKEQPQMFTASFQHVRFRASDNNWVDHPHFQFWAESNVPVDVRKHIWLSEMWRPSIENIRHIVVLMAGQQGPRYSSASFANIMTGQPAKWRPKGHHKMAAVKLHKDSIAGKIYDDGTHQGGEKYGFTPHNTLFILVSDTGFYYMLQRMKKRQIVEAFERYLLQRIEGAEHRVRAIYFGGTSRGGALAFRLTKRLLQNQSLSSAHFLLTTLDAVANPHQAECMTYKERSYNPLNSKLYAFKADLSQFFRLQSSQTLDIFQVVGGSSVIAENIERVGVARPFVDKSYSSQQDHQEDLHPYPFSYTVRWVSKPHTFIGRTWSPEASGAALLWLREIRSR